MSGFIVRTKRFRLLIIATVISTIAFAAGMITLRWLDTDPQPPDIPGLLWPGSKTISDFSLRDHRGEVFDNHALRGRWHLLFFGYTHCPDVCPHIVLTLANMEKQLRSRVDHNDRTQIRFVFVSIDPERDTPDSLGSYTPFFNPEFLGVTGSEQKLAELTRQLGVLAVRQADDANGHYLIDHSTVLMLIDPEAHLVGVFQPPHNMDDIRDRIVQIQTFIAG